MGPVFSAMGESDSLHAMLYGRHCLGYPIVLIRNDLKLRTPGTLLWYPILLPPYSSNSATYTLVTYEPVLPGKADFVGSTEAQGALAPFCMPSPPPLLAIIWYIEDYVEFNWPLIGTRYKNMRKIGLSIFQC